MNIHEKMHIDMQKDVVNFCKNRAGDFAQVPKFTDAVNQLDMYNITIMDLEKKLEVSTAGYTLTKNKAREQLFKLVMPVLRNGIAFANAEDNDELRNRLKYTSSELKKQSDNIFNNNCMQIRQALQEYITQLTSYGITEAMLLAIETESKNFDSKIAGLPEYRAELHVAKSTQKKYFADARNLLDYHMDTLVELIRVSKPETFGEYKKLRYIGYAGSRKPALKVHIELAASHLPLSNVSISILTPDPQTITQTKTGGAGLVKHVKRTNANGNCVIKHLESGTYIIEATKNGYLPLRLEVFINPNETTFVNLVFVAKN